MIYSKITNSILVAVTPEYQATRSSPFDSEYVWTYHIHIENKGKQRVQLLNRHWHIIDAMGQVRNVFGPGVVGMHPVFEMGDEFGYESFVELPTPSGMMLGYYEMVTNDGEIIRVEIPAFSLDCPHEKAVIN